MGGSGSGRRYVWDKKTTVEECRALDAARWMREGILLPDVRKGGSWVWMNAYTKQQTASIGYVVDTMDPPYCTVRLFYTVTPYAGEPKHYDYKILLVTTRPHFGGVRWWFRCPLTRNGVPCFRRVQKLYMPPGNSYYGCRHCYDLTYTSSQESDKRVSRLANNPLSLYAALARSIDDTGADTMRGLPDLLLALKAEEKARKKMLKAYKRLA